MHLQFKIHRHTQRENIEKEEPTKKNKQEYPKKKISLMERKLTYLTRKKVFFLHLRKFCLNFMKFFTHSILPESQLLILPFFYLDTKHFLFLF